MDELTFVLESGRPLRVATILSGGPVRAHRSGRWMVWLSRGVRALLRVRREGVSRIPFSAVRSIGDCIELDVDGTTLESMHLERWLGDHLICRLPGSGGETK